MQPLPPILFTQTLIIHFNRVSWSARTSSQNTPDIPFPDPPHTSKFHPEGLPVLLFNLQDWVKWATPDQFLASVISPWSRPPPRQPPTSYFSSWPRRRRSNRARRCSAGLPWRHRRIRMYKPNIAPTSTRRRRFFVRSHSRLEPPRTEWTTWRPPTTSQWIRRRRMHLPQATRPHSDIVVNT